MTGRCPQCGQSTAPAQDVIDGRADYADTQGGHNDRHTLVTEEADRVVSAASRGGAS